MKTAHILLTGLILVLLACAITATAQIDTFLLSGETLTVSTGESMDRVVVYPNATLIIDGGSITNSATMESVEISAGGTCVMQDGYADYFLNMGRLELYGGNTDTDYSTMINNYGYMKLAGAHIGRGARSLAGIMEIFYPASTTTNMMISSVVTNTPPTVIRIFSVSNSLGYGQFELADLPPLGYGLPPSQWFDMQTEFWSPEGTFTIPIRILIHSNWNGVILSEPFEIPTSTSVVCTIDSAVDLTWGSTSNRGYQLQSTTNLLSGDWENLGVPFYDSSGGNLHFDEANEDIKAYRAKIVH